MLIEGGEKDGIQNFFNEACRKIFIFTILKIYFFYRYYFLNNINLNLENVSIYFFDFMFFS